MNECSLFIFSSFTFIACCVWSAVHQTNIVLYGIELMNKCHKQTLNFRLAVNPPSSTVRGSSTDLEFAVGTPLQGHKLIA